MSDIELESFLELELEIYISLAQWSPFMADDEIIQKVIKALVDNKLIEAKKEKRKRTNWERILCEEFVRKTFEGHPYWLRKEVGAYYNQDTERYYARTRRWVDAIIRTDQGIALIEAKMKTNPGAVSQLQQYAMLFPQTPEFRRYKDEKLRLIVLTAMDVPEVKTLAEMWNMEYAVYKPSNYEQWLQTAILKNSYENIK